MSSHSQTPQASKAPQIPQSSRLPPLQHLVRNIDGVYTIENSPKSWKKQWENKKMGKKYVPSSKVMIKYTADGKLHAIAERDRVMVYDSQSLKLVQPIKSYDSEIIDFSPKGTYLLTYYRKMKSDRRPNMIIWEVATGNLVREFHQKEYIPSNRPIVWTKDENILLHLVTNGVNVYNGNKPKESLGTIKMDGVSQLYLSPGSRDQCYIAIFVPEVKGSAAKIMVYKYPDLEKPTATKQFFKAQDAIIKWNHNGNYLIAQTSTDISNNTYYGETGLHFMASDGSCNRTVSFGSNKGPVQAAEWSPMKDEFIVIQGFQPAKIQLYNGKTCVPARSYGIASRNHIIWSPHGRFVCFGAFDNLGTGEMDFWDVNNFKKIGHCKDMDAPSFYEWTPDSRVLITAVLYPTRRTDNGYKAWTYYGDLLFHENVEKIYQVAIQSTPCKLYPDRAVSPRIAGRAVQKSRVQAPAPKAYIPPHMRHKIKAKPAPVAENKKTARKKRRAKPIVENEQERKEREKRMADQKEQEDNAALERIKEDPVALRKLSQKIKKTLKQIVSLKTQEESGKTLDKNQKKKVAQQASYEAMLEKMESFDAFIS